MEQVAQADPSPQSKKELEKARAQRLRELRAIALFALTYDSSGLPMWQYYAELKHLRMRPLLAEWYEARIALNIAAEIRPSATLRAINELRALRAKRGEEEKFHKFEALFKSALGQTRFTNHGYGGNLLSDVDHSAVWARVSRHITVLSDRGYEVFLNSGTLLGVVRDQKLIDHDDDIDLAVILKAGSAVEAAAEWKGLTEDIRELGILDEENFGMASIIKLLPVDKVQIDLFPAWFEEDRLFVFPHTFGQLTRGDVLPLRPCAVSGNPIPAEPEKMLAINYGDGWREPDPYFKFPWVEAKRKFKTFQEALA
ncbi:LicD family protein [Aestuariivita boseongensis]|uniref:LicD family protein n=1 Tax=Aestuariivita boseongensis TaxID=1470562 RepID=UPI000682ED1B|nr:LicD family protein [Aestuariivita boseongensis]